MTFLVLLVVVVAVVVIIAGPLRRPKADSRALERATPATDQAVRELEAAREAKHREIRDAELDHRTGKLSDADFEAIDSTLRAEAIAILKRLDATGDTAAILKRLDATGDTAAAGGEGTDGDRAANGGSASPDPPAPNSAR